MADKARYDNDAVQTGDPTRRAAEDKQLRSAQQDRALDENDPRVKPHLERAEVVAGTEADETQRQEQTLVQAQDKLEDARAAVEAAADQAREAEEALASARQRYAGCLEGLTKLDRPTSRIVPAHHLSPGEDTVPMFFPHPVQITHQGLEATFPAGIRQVPVSLQTHWWLTANGARLYKGKMPEAPDRVNEPEAVAERKSVRGTYDDEYGPVRETRPASSQMQAH